MKFTIADQYVTRQNGFTMNHNSQISATFELDKSVCPGESLKSIDLYCIAAEAAAKLAAYHVCDFQLSCQRSTQLYFKNNRCGNFRQGKGSCIGLITKRRAHTMEITIKVSLIGSIANSGAFQQFVFTVHS